MKEKESYAGNNIESPDRDYEKMTHTIFKIDKSTYSRFGLSPDEEVSLEDVSRLIKVVDKKGPQVLSRLYEDMDVNQGMSEEDKAMKVKSLAWHDLFHGAVAYERSGGERFESIFLTLEDDVEKAVHEESMREELDALFWDTVLNRKHNLFTSLTTQEGVDAYRSVWVDRFYPKDQDHQPIINPDEWNEEQRKAHPYKFNIANSLETLSKRFEDEIVSPEEIFEIYQGIIVSIVREINIESIKKLNESEEKKEELRRTLEGTITDILNNPDPRTKERFNRLWDEYSNNKQIMLQESLGMTRGVWED